MLADFKKFILRGNVLDLAVAVVIGAAFGAVVKSFVDNIVLQLIGGLFGKTSFNDALILQNADHTKVYLKVGAFITDLLSFLIIASALFVIVKAFEKLQSLRKTGDVEEVDEPLTHEGALLTEIRDLLRDRAA